MIDEEELQHAIGQAEGETAVLQRELARLAAQRHARSQPTLLALEARKAELTDSLRALSAAQGDLEAEKRKLRKELARPRLGWSSLIASPLTWFFRGAVFTVYVSSVLAAQLWFQSPGLVLALVLGLPVAFVLVMVAGSLRESGAAGTTGVSAGPGEEPARVPGVELEGRVVAAPGGPVDDRAAERGAARPPAGDREGL